MGHTVRGKRGGSNRRRDDQETVELHDIHSKIAGLPSGTHKGHAHNLHGSSATAAVEHAAKYYECSYSEERADTHVIPRQSITRQQLLGVFPQQLEMEPIPGKQLDRVSGELVEVNNNRLAWKSDKTLLRRGNPFQDAESGNRDGYKRQGRVSLGNNSRNYTKGIENAQEPKDVILGPAFDAPLEDL